MSAAGCRWRRNTAFAGQSVVQVLHSVFCGNACTSGAVPRKRITHTPTKPPNTARSNRLVIRPPGNENKRKTAHGRMSQVEMRPIVKRTLCDDSVSAVTDQRKPMQIKAIPNLV